MIGFYYDGDLMATLTTSGSTNFSLAFIGAPDSTAFINDLLLEYTGSLAGTTFGQLGGDTADPVSFCTAGPGCAVEGTDANVKVSWATAGGDARFQIGETSNFSITTTDASLWDFTRLHINAFLDGESIKLTGSDCTDRTCTPPGGSVPEPGSLALIGLALLGAGVGTRRRAK